MADTINISRIQTTKNYDLKKIYNETKYYEDETYNDSPFSLNTNDFKYISSVEFFKAFKPGNISLSVFCINHRSLEAYWYSFQVLLFNMSSNGLILDFIGITEIFLIQDVLRYKINVYHNLLFNTRPDISDKFIYSMYEDFLIFIPHVFESIFF